MSPQNRRKRHFELASQLYQSVKRLADPKDREIYGMEVEQVSTVPASGWELLSSSHPKVCSLMLSATPEASRSAPYLSMMRREAIADQVNNAMLCE